MKSCEIEYKKIFDKGQYSGLLELADAKILTHDGCSFDVHKVMLARCSEFFRAMFCGLEKGKEVYEISAIGGVCLSEILVFIYTGIICVNELNIKDLLFAADYFTLRHLYLTVKSHVKSTLTTANCLKLCFITHLLGDKEIFRCCLNFIVRRFEEIAGRQRKDFEDLPLDLLKLILSNRNLYNKCENKIWEVILQWVRAFPETRYKQVADLLSILAVGEISANFGIIIVNNTIVFSNVHMKALNDRISLFGINRARDALIDFAKDFNPNNFTIPEKLTLISESGTITLKLFVLFDDRVDLWYKVIEIPNFRMEKLVAVNSKIYFFERNMKQKCMIFDLETTNQTLVENSYLLQIRSIVAVENTFYTIFYENNNCHINEYDIEEGKYLHISLLADFNFPVISATTIGQDIFIVARNQWKDPNNIVTWMFSVVTRQWTNLSSPTKFHTVYKLVSYHKKIYLIDPGSLRPCTPEVEVFDPEVNVWKVLPDLHNIYFNADFVILSDKLIVYDHENELRSGNAELWNNDKECWEVLEKTASYGRSDFRWYQSCAINDTALINIIKKRIRKNNVKMEEIRFIL